jgi:hypothetical protein
LVPTVARADGDPASDVLASQPLFLPPDAGLSTDQQLELSALLATAGRRGYPIRVALIASADDLGSVTALWRQPQTYARFLGQELSLLHRGPLLVVMPNGYGLYQPTGADTPERSALAGLSPARSDFGATTITAIERLAAASGHALPIQTVTVRPAAASSDTVQWLVFAIGAALVALGWTASLRARPLRARSDPATHTIRS